VNDIEPSIPDTDPPSQGTGSLVAGIALAWAIVVAGHAMTLAAVLSRSSGVGTVLTLLSPEIVCVATGGVLLATGNMRIGKGVFLGLASIAAVVLLLLAACFGLLRQ